MSQIYFSDNTSIRVFHDQPARLNTGSHLTSYFLLLIERPPRDQAGNCMMHIQEHDCDHHGTSVKFASSTVAVQIPRLRKSTHSAPQRAIGISHVV